MHPLATLVALLLSTPAFAQATISSLGALTPQSDSAATAISSDGQTVVGNSGSGGSLQFNSAFRWTHATRMQSLGDSSFSLAVNADGSVVVGLAGYYAFRWTAQSGQQLLGTLPTCLGSINAQAVSADGAIVAGSSCHAFVWTMPSGLHQLPELAGYAQSAAHAMSADGAVIVGSSDNPASQTSRACAWIGSPGQEVVRDLGLLSGTTSSAAFAVNPAGTIIVGISGTHPFRITDVAGMQDLGLPSGAISAQASAVNANGTVIVGFYNTSPSVSRAFIWTPATGSQDLAAYLSSHGANLSGWTLTSATGVTSNARSVAGFGVFNNQNRAWLATLPAQCGSADFNHDGDTGTDQDIAAFFACLSGTCCPACGSADFNADGDVGTDQDIEAFFRVLGGGPC